MDAWLSAIAADTAPGDTAERAARNRPAAATPGCWPTTGGAKVDDLAACYDSPFTYTGDLRTVAGAPITSDITCQRTVPVPENYDVAFNDEQWERLEEIFASGVCDYTQPGIGQVPLAGLWQTYG
jgi:hypothetical protein